VKRRGLTDDQLTIAIALVAGVVLVLIAILDASSNL
jgi:hypothetical protein